MKLSLENHKLFIEEYLPWELEEVKKCLTWVNRSGSVRDLKVGDIVKIKNTKHFYKKEFGIVSSIKDKKVKVIIDDTKQEKECLIFHLERYEAETIVYPHKSGRMFFYRGLIKILNERTHVQFEIINKEENTLGQKVSIPKDLLPGFEFLNFQTHTIEKCIRSKNGLCVLPVGSGKTECIIGFLKYALDNGLIKKALVIAPSDLLVQQMVDRAYLRGLSATEISHKKYNSSIVVDMPMSILNEVNNPKSKYSENFFKDLNCIIIDESQHAQADTYIQIFDKLPTEYMLGFSGSPFLYTDPLHEISDAVLYGVTGGPIVKITYPYLRSIGLMAEPIIYQKKIGGSPLKNSSRFDTIYDKWVVNNDERNNAIESYIRRLHSQGHTTLILIKRLEHAHILMNMVKDLKPLAVFGNRKGSYFDDYGEQIDYEVDYNTVRQQIDDGMWPIVFGSTVFDEGFDAPGLTALILASGGKSRIKLIQRLGRGSRKKRTGPNRVLVLDFDDCTHVYLKSHSKKRMELFNEVGATLLDKEISFNRYIYENKMGDNEVKNNVP